MTGKMQKPYVIPLPWARALHIISKMSYDHNQIPFILAEPMLIISNEIVNPQIIVINYQKLELGV